MLQSIILNLVFSYLAHALAAAEGAINWDKIQADLDAKLKAVLPGWLEGEVQLLLDNAIYLVKKVAGTDGVFKQLISLIAAKDFSGIVSYLEQLVMGELQHVSAAHPEASLADLVKSYKAV